MALMSTSSAKSSATPQCAPLPTPTAEDFAFSRLIAYAAFQWPGYRDARHHRLIARKLEQVERGEVTRLMIFMPPRHGKSMLASEFFPAWYLGRNPDHYVVAATYGQELADDFGRKVKNQIADPAYREVFPGVGLADDSRSSKRFHISSEPTEGGYEHSVSQGGAYYAVGVGGPLTGRGAHLLLIDDPVKNREDADSELTRKKIMEWYTSTAYTRLMPGGRVVVIQTRWHEEDLAGWLLDKHTAEGWDVLNLPALTGDAPLWPEQYPLQDLLRIKAAIGPRDWSALYQQAPSPDEGTFFQRDWFKTWSKRPDNLSIYGTSDYAVTDGGGDFTVHRVWGVDPAGDLYRLAGWRGQTSADVWIDRKLDLIKEWKPFAWFGEAGVIQKAVEPMLRRRMLERSVFCRMEWLASISDKPTRARGFQARAAMGKTQFEAGADISEFLKFPAGSHDDEVDVASLIGRALDEAHPAVVPVKPVSPFIDRWDEVMNRDRMEEDSWKVS